MPTFSEVKQQFRDRQHRPVDLLVSIVSLTGLFITAYIVRQPDIPAWEVSVFRFINGWPDWLFPFIWPFMQYGVFLTIPVVAIVAAYFRRYRLAILLLAGGVGIYFLALVVKEVVSRMRPVDLFEAIQARENVRHGSLGFPSGHGAVASTIATLANRYLSKKWQILSIFTLCVVVVGRIYVGAHLPLDMFGGLFLGIFIASLLNFTVGVPTQQNQN